MDIYDVLNWYMSFLQTYWWIYCVAALIPMVILGIFTAKLAHKKGYRGYFFTGFFFNFIGLIYVVGLPLAKDCVGRANVKPAVKEEKAIEA